MRACSVGLLTKLITIAVLSTILRSHVLDACLVRPDSFGHVYIPDTVTYIPPNAFFNCVELRSITIPQSVTSIGSNAFSHSSSLEQVNIPMSVSTIQNGTFAYCLSLRSVTIPNSITAIQDYAFFEASSLVEVTIPSSVHDIGVSAFRNCVGITILELPPSLLSLGNSSFRNCSSLVTLFIPDSVIAMGEYLLTDCTSMTYVNISAPIQNISQGIFNGCISLTTVHIPRTTISLEEGVFAGCTSLRAVSIPDSLMRIGVGCFLDCISLESIYIPSAVTSIDNLAFSNCLSLSHVSLPPQIQSIEFAAFYNCSSLESINIPEGLVSIGKSAFQYSGMKTIHFPNTLTSIGIASFDSTFLESVTIPANVTMLGRSAFSTTHYLRNVTFEGNNTQTDALSFRQCIGFGLFTDAATVEIQDDYADDYAAPLSTYQSGMYECLPCGVMHAMVIPDVVTGIDRHVFEDCDQLRSVVIADSVTFIGRSAFSSCTALTSVTLPDRLSSLGGGAFLDCVSLVNLTLPNSIVRLERLTLANCSNLSSVELPSNLTYIGDSAFSQTSSLEEISLPSTVEMIGVLAFSQMPITEIHIPNGVTVISSALFMSDRELQIVVLSNSITYIGNGSFMDCSKLTSISIPDSVVSMGLVVFWNCTSLLSGHVFSQQLTIVEAGTLQYGTSIQEITIPNSVTIIGEGAFAQCWELQRITLPESLLFIRANALLNTTSLKEIHIPDNTLFIGELAFASSGLSHASIPLTVTYVDQSAFYGCYLCLEGNTYKTAYSIADEGYKAYGEVTERIVSPFSYSFCQYLQQVWIADTVARIRSYAITSNFHLREMVIPDSVELVEQNAFRSSTGLVTIAISPNAIVHPDAFAQCGCDASLYRSGAVLSECAEAFVFKYDGGTYIFKKLQCNRTSQYELSPGTYTTDRECDDASFCNFSMQYEAAPLTRTSDRKCPDITSCRAGVTYERNPPTHSTDRQCFDLTHCNHTHQYESAPPTATSDRRCRNITLCNYTFQYQVHPPSETTNRVCANVSAPCGPSANEIAAGTPTSDRVCRDATALQQPGTNTVTLVLVTVLVSILLCIIAMFMWRLRQIQHEREQWAKIFEAAKNGKSDFSLKDHSQILFVAMKYNRVADIPEILRRHSSLARELDSERHTPHLRMLQIISKHGGSKSKNDVEAEEILQEALEALYRNHWVLSEPIIEFISHDGGAHAALVATCSNMAETFWRSQDGTESTVLHCVLHACVNGATANETKKELANQTKIELANTTKVALAKAALVDGGAMLRCDSNGVTPTTLVLQCTSAPELQATLIPEVYGKYLLPNIKNITTQSNDTVILDCLAKQSDYRRTGPCLPYRSNFTLKMTKDRASWLRELIASKYTSSGHVVPIDSAGCPPLSCFPETSFEVVRLSPEIAAGDYKFNGAVDKLVKDFPFVICRPRAEGTVAEILAKEQGASSSLLDTTQMLLQIGRAIASLHVCGVAHRNITPWNIVKYRLNEHFCTFSIASLERSTIISSPQAVRENNERGDAGLRVLLGACDAYLPPMSEEREPKAVDIWSFGVAMYEALAGTPLFAHVRGKATEASVRQLREWKNPSEAQMKLVGAKWADSQLTDADRQTLDAAKMLLKKLLSESGRSLEMSNVLEHKFFDSAKSSADMEEALNAVYQALFRHHQTTPRWGRVKISYCHIDSQFVVGKLALKLASLLRQLWLNCVDCNSTSDPIVKHVLSTNMEVVDLHIAVVSPAFLAYSTANDGGDFNAEDVLPIPYNFVGNERHNIKTAPLFVSAAKRYRVGDSWCFTTEEEFEKVIIKRLIPVIKEIRDAKQRDDPDGALGFDEAYYLGPVRLTSV
eukprot:m.1491324 g.1491324  ORF g.1491324 m.1491324 type:complete len:1842 (-) comp25192_c1_seq6:719-6244(-)